MGDEKRVLDQRTKATLPHLRKVGLPLYGNRSNAINLDVSFGESALRVQQDITR